MLNSIKQLKLFSELTVCSRNFSLKTEAARRAKTEAPSKRRKETDEKGWNFDRISRAGSWEQTGQSLLL